MIAWLAASSRPVSSATQVRGGVTDDRPHGRLLARGKEVANRRDTDEPAVRRQEKNMRRVRVMLANQARERVRPFPKSAATGTGETR